jgi:DNA-binding XRE family transcriptional regulator
MARFREPGLVNRVREYRELLNITQEALAEAAGVRRVTVQRLDAHASAMPSLETALRLSSAFGIPVEQLVSQL